MTTTTTKCGVQYVAPDGKRAVTFCTKAQGRNADGEMTYETLFQVVLRNSQEIADLINNQGYTNNGVTYNIV